MRDFLIADQRSGPKWIDENVVCEPWQWLGGALCVDRRYARDLSDEIAAAGFDLAI
jgi:hypothetical protein